jgi:hypothetical protein
MDAWERRWGCVFMCLWLLTVGSLIAAVAVHDPASRVRGLGVCVGAFGIAFLWGVVHVLKSGRFSWSRPSVRLPESGVTHRRDNALAFWTFVAFLGLIALAMLVLAGWLMANAPHVAAWLAK